MKTKIKQPIMNKTIETDTIHQYTITNISVDWDSMGVSEEENNEETYDLGVGSGYVFKNGKIYINSSQFGEDDEFVQLVFINDTNETLEEIHNYFENFTYESGVFFRMFGLYVEGFKIEPLNNKMVKSIYENPIKIESLININ